MDEELKACPFCGETLRINNARLAVHSRNSECLLRQQPIVVDDKDQVERWNTRATHPAAASVGGGEAVAVVAYIDGGGAIYTARLLEIMSVEPYGCEPLMTVAQHQRILAASVPRTSESVATDAFVPGSLADLLFQLGEKGIQVSGGTHGDHWRVTPLYTHPADQVAEAVAWLTSDKRHLVFSGALDQSQYVEQGMTPLYTHPADQVAEGDAERASLNT